MHPITIIYEGRVAEKVISNFQNFSNPCLEKLSYIDNSLWNILEGDISLFGQKLLRFGNGDSRRSFVFVIFCAISFEKGKLKSGGPYRSVSWRQI